MSTVKSPKSWSECLDLLGSDDLDLALQVRLVDLAFNGQDSVSVKAIEILRSMPKPERDDPFSDVPIEILKQERERVRAWKMRLTQ